MLTFGCSLSFLKAYEYVLAEETSFLPFIYPNKMTPLHVFSNGHSYMFATAVNLTPRSNRLFNTTTSWENCSEAEQAPGDLKWPHSPGQFT